MVSARHVVCATRGLQIMVSLLPVCHQQRGSNRQINAASALDNSKWMESVRQADALSQSERWFAPSRDGKRACQQRATTQMAIFLGRIPFLRLLWSAPNILIPKHATQVPRACLHPPIVISQPWHPSEDSNSKCSKTTETHLAPSIGQQTTLNIAKVSRAIIC